MDMKVLQEQENGVLRRTWLHKENVMNNTKQSFVKSTIVSVKKTKFLKRR
jgi:hypothetical protein